MAVNVLEFLQVPARILDYEVVEGGFEACSCYAGYLVLQLRQRVADAEFGCDVCDGVACCFACKG